MFEKKTRVSHHEEIAYIFIEIRKRERNDSSLLCVREVNNDPFREMKPFQKSTRKLSTGSFKPSAGPTNPFEETRKASTHYCFLLVFFCSFYFFALKNRAVVNCSEPHQIRRPSFGRRSYHLASESKRFISGRRYARNETMEGNGSSLLRSRFSLST